MELSISKLVELYDYQKQALKDIVAAFKVQMAVLVVMATGLGKTKVAAHFARQEFKEGKRGLFLCHDNGIMDQAILEFSEVLGSRAVIKTFYGTDKDWNADKADMLFASFQSFREWCVVFDQKHFDYIIVDESHHGHAETYRDVIQYFQPEKLLGMTATPNRGDEQDIREIFGEEVVSIPLPEALAKGWLTQVEYHILNDGIDTKKLREIAKSVLEEGQRISVKQLNESIFVELRDEVIAKQILKYSEGKQTIVFCENIVHTENFQQYLPNSAVIHSKITVKNRNRKTLEEFKNGNIQYLHAVNKLNEGIDAPSVEVGAFLRATDSETIFWQQLGRLLRKMPGKEKVVVLDFVCNCERLMMMRDLAREVKEFAGSYYDLTKDKLMVNGASFDFIFSDEQIDILEIFDRLNVEFYKTWQEASEVCIANKVLGVIDYRNRRKAMDQKLHSHPNIYYKDFPGWSVFLDKFYKTWQEASAVCIANKVSGKIDYRRRYKLIDPKLHGSPDIYYKDFPGFVVFCGGESKEFYKTWQEASEVCIANKVSDYTDYNKRYKIIDPKLPSNPNIYYEDFPGFVVFCGGESKEFYKTWQEASAVCIANKVSGYIDYRGRYALIDPKLCSRPNAYYKDFPGWLVFLDKFYKTWQEASAVCIANKVSGQVDYGSHYKLIDPKLPSDPYGCYKDFPGWKIFLGKE